MIPIECLKKISGSKSFGLIPYSSVITNSDIRSKAYVITLCLSRSKEIKYHLFRYSFSNNGTTFRAFGLSET